MTMSRSSRWPVVVVVSASALLIVIGCYSRPTDVSSARQGTVPVAVAVPGGESTAAGQPTKLFANWPAPAGALIITGEQIGYLEPCGCTAGQKGGLARRLDLIEKLKAQGWQLVRIDLGSLINDPNTHGGPEETKARFEYALKALEMMDYDAVALSASDLKIGVGEAVIRMINAGEKPRFVCANVLPNQANDLGLGGKLVPSVRAAAGPVKVGITAVLAPESFEALQDPEKTIALDQHDAHEAVGKVLADLERDTHIQILMVQGPPDAAREYARAHPGFEILVATSLSADPVKDDEVMNEGRTHILSVGKKGQYVGVLGLFQDPKQKFRYKRLELGPKFNNKTEAMRKLIDEDFQDDLRRRDVLHSFPRLNYAFGAERTEAKYVGAETCKECHAGTYAKWASTGHARGYEGLTKDPKRNREFDADCVRCHTTGFAYNGGFVTAEETRNLKGNQCENCHGPGSLHAASPDDTALRKAMARSAGDFDRNHRCLECHTEDDSPHFEFPIYYGKIAHKGLDRYDDPKVHKGINPPAR
jgi:hypothetical protein